MKEAQVQPGQDRGVMFSYAARGSAAGQVAGESSGPAKPGAAASRPESGVMSKGTGVVARQEAKAQVRSIV